MMKSRVLSSDLLRVCAALVMVFVVVVQVDAAVPNYNPLRDPSFGPIPGEDPSYSDYLGVAPPFPANLSSPILNTTSGTPGLDDVVFQNLLSAEWLVYNVYQQGVELFNASDFINAGFPNTTFDRIAQIRDSEAGHSRVFQDQISNASVVPGPCKYDYRLTGDPAQFLAFATFIELTSMALVSGLTEQVKLDISKGALAVIGQAEARHEAWFLTDIWGSPKYGGLPFAGPVDTFYPYATQILDTTIVFIVNGSCPPANPPYPIGAQNIPRLRFNTNTTSTLTPGTTIELIVERQLPNTDNYYAVFFHALNTYSVPFNTSTGIVTIPAQIEPLGLLLIAIADEPGAPTAESVVAGPLPILLAPLSLRPYLAGYFRP
ncbi:unnamed protein product [Sphagnum jensenii]|uniref:Ferritin-like domain-containing protein n=1 Tax=Sphagnum jensenii TaxID=128206 RepID=A0ABP0WQ50_9BRYO